MDCHRKGVPLRCGLLREGTLYVLGIEWEGGDRYLPQHCASVGTGELARKGARATQREERKRTEEGPGSIFWPRAMLFMTSMGEMPV